MLLSPILLALGLGRDEHPQCQGPVRRRRGRADRLQPGDHRRGDPARPGDGRGQPGDRRRRRVGLHMLHPAACRSGDRASAGQPRIDLGDPAARQALVLMVPRAVGLGASQLTFLVVDERSRRASAPAPSAPSTSRSRSSRSRSASSACRSASSCFPSMSRDLAPGATDEFLSLLTRAPAAPVRDAADHGAGDRGAGAARRGPVRLRAVRRAAIGLTADALLFFLLGLAAHSLIAVLARAFYAGRDTRRPSRPRSSPSPST